MSAIQHSCRNCGRIFDYPLEKPTFPCPACGEMHGRPKSEGESLTWLRRANEERANCEFTHAEMYYRQVLGRHPDEHEALWGLVLCKHGVEILEGRPTVRILQRQNILDDADYLKACQLAPDDVREGYERIARYVSQVQKNIPPMDGPGYDVFLCYRSDDQKAREYQHALGLYADLREQGYSVFFAERTLRKELGTQYEAKIFHALYSARVMLLICSDAKNLYTTWVSSEWRRFIQRFYQDGDCRLIPILYDGCNAYEMPGELQHLESLVVGQNKWWNDLLENLQRIIRPKKTARNGDSLTLNRLMFNAQYQLENGNWDSAASIAQSLREGYSDCADGYILCLLAKLKAPSLESLAERTEAFENEPDWRWAVKQADEGQQAELNRVLTASQALRAQRAAEKRAREAREAEQRRRAAQERQERQAREAEERRRAEAERREREEREAAEAERLAEEERIARQKREAEQVAWNTAVKQAQRLRTEEKWAQALEQAEQMIRLRENRAEGYLERLLANRQLKTREELADCTAPFDTEPDWLRAISRASSAQRPKLMRILKDYQERAERRESDRIYAGEVSRAKALLKNGEWEQAARVADALEDRGEKPLLQLLARYHLPEEAALAEADAECFQDRLFIEYSKQVDDRKLEQLEEYCEAANLKAERRRKAGNARHALWSTLLSLGWLGAYFFALGNWPDAAPVITMGAAAATTVLLMLLACVRKPRGRVLRLLSCCAIGGAAVAVAVMTALPDWAYFLAALGFALPGLFHCRRKSLCCYAVLPVFWLFVSTELTLVKLLPGAELAASLSGIAGSWWFALLVVAVNLLLVLKGKAERASFGGGCVLLATAMLLPGILCGLESLLPAWSGALALGAAVLLAAVCALAVLFDRFLLSSVWLWVVLLAAAAVAAVLLIPAPAWVFVLAGLVVTVVFMGVACVKLDDLSAAVLLPGLWLALHLGCQLLGLLIDAPWLSVAAMVVDTWVAPVVMLLACLLAGFEANVGIAFRLTGLAVCGLLGLCTALAVLGIPTYGVVVLQQQLPEWMGLAALGGALLAFMIYAVNRRIEAGSGAGMIVLGVLLIAAVAASVFIWPVPQVWYLIAAGALSLILTISAFVSLAGFDPVPWPLPATIWLTLHCGVCILAQFSDAAWVQTALSITRWWLPGAAVLVWIGAIIWCIGDDEGWW